MSIGGSRLPGAVIGMSRPAPKFKCGDIVSLVSSSGNRLVGKIFIIDWRGGEVSTFRGRDIKMGYRTKLRKSQLRRWNMR